MVSTTSFWLGLSTFLLPVALILLLRQRQSRRGSKPPPPPPPGPSGWPIFGNIFDLGGAIPHQTLNKLRFKYGPVVWLRLGSMNTMVIQSAKSAADLFKNHDQTFCDRKCLTVFTAHTYNKGSIAVGQYGPHWRRLRHICTVQLFSNKRINETAHLRRKCIDDMIRNIVVDSTMAKGGGGGESEEVNLTHLLFLMSFNLIGNLVFSRDLLDSRSKEGYAFFDAMNKFMEWMGKPNLADFFPFLKWLDPQAIMKNSERYLEQAMNIVEAFVRERMEEYKSGRREEKKKQDFLDMLLDYDGDGKDGMGNISHHNLIIIVLVSTFRYTKSPFLTFDLHL